jgi:ComEC/Rec2-related protein
VFSRLEPCLEKVYCFAMRTGLGQSILQIHQQQPLLIGGTCFIVGICLGFMVQRMDEPWVIAGASLFAVTFLFYRWLRQAKGFQLTDLLLIGVCSLFLGAGRAAWDCAGRENESAWFARGAKKSPATLSCTIGPDVMVIPIRGHAARYTFKGFDVKVQTPRGDKAVTYLPLTVNWYASIEDKASAPKAGERWRFRGSATTSKARRSQLTVLTLNTGKSETRSLRLTTCDTGIWPSRIEQVRRDSMRRIAIGIEDWGVVPELNQAMLLGYNSEMPEAMRRIFCDSGTIHVFAVSGMHIAFIAGMLVLVVGMTGLKRIHWAFLIVPLLIAYTLVTGSRPSAIRSCVMGIFVFLAPLVGRRPTMLTSLTLTAVVVHIWKPDFVFDIGSVLSFAVVVGLIAFMGPFCEIFQSLFGCVKVKKHEEMLLVAGNTKKAAWIHRGGIVLRFFADSVAVSLAAFLASVPLTGYYFGRFTPGGLFANLLIAPFSGLIVVAGTLGLFASFIHAWLANTFNHATGFLTMVMVRTAEVTAGCPGLGYNTGKWEIWQVVVWLTGLALLAGWMWWRRKPKDGLAWLTENEKI